MFLTGLLTFVSYRNLKKIYEKEMLCKTLL